MATEHDVGAHLLDCADTVYRVLGQGAPTLTCDAYVVRTHEMSRAFGALALELRQHLDNEPPQPVPVLEAVLTHALLSDPTGAMALFAMAMVVGPRLLVSLLDARAAVGPGALADLLSRASDVVVYQIRLTGYVARDQAPIEDASWQAAARDLADTLDSAGYVENLGISR